MLILNLLNKTKHNQLKKAEIFSLLKDTVDEESVINMVLNTMIAKGIIIPSFLKGEITYLITDFGVYFFNKLEAEHQEYFREANFEVTT